MILRLDRVGISLPPPSDPDPEGAAAVQELMGGKFGEMSTWLNYTFQSFNFRAQQGARPFYDLLCSIGAEEFGHVELVAATINTMLTGASPTDDGRAPEAALARPEGDRQPAPLPRRRPGRAAAELAGPAVERGLRLLLRGPGGGPDPQLLPRDRRAQQQAEGLRDGGASRGACVDRLPARARRRAPGCLRAGPRAPDGGRPDEDVPVSADPDREDPRVEAAHRARRAPEALPLLAGGVPRGRRRVQRPASGDRGGADGRRRPAPARRARARPAAATGRVRARLRAGGDRRDRPEAPQEGGSPGRSHRHRLGGVGRHVPDAHREDRLATAEESPPPGSAQARRISVIPSRTVRITCSERESLATCSLNSAAGGVPSTTRPPASVLSTTIRPCSESRGSTAS